MNYLVSIPNAFTINLQGGGFFPLAATASARESSSILQIQAQRVIDIADLLDNNDQLVVFGANEVSSDKTLREHAEQENIEVWAIDDDTLVIDAGMLQLMLEWFSHYNLSAMNLASDASEEDIIAAILCFQEQQDNWRSPKLPYLPLTDYLISSHDDCYLLVEARTLGLPKAVFERTLQTYVGTVLMQNKVDSAPIISIPMPILDSLYPLNAPITILRKDTTWNRDKLRVGISREVFNPIQRLDYPVVQTLIYAPSTGLWEFEQGSSTVS